MSDCGLDKWIYLAGIAATVAPLILTMLISFFMMIPGEQPEKFLIEKVKPISDKIIQLIQRFSRK